MLDWSIRPFTYNVRCKVFICISISAVHVKVTPLNRKFYFHIFTVQCTYTLTIHKIFGTDGRGYKTFFKIKKSISNE